MIRTGTIEKGSYPYIRMGKSPEALGSLCIFSVASNDFFIGTKTDKDGNKVQTDMIIVYTCIYSDPDNCKVYYSGRFNTVDNIFISAARSCSTVDKFTNRRRINNGFYAAFSRALDEKGYPIYEVIGGDSLDEVSSYIRNIGYDFVAQWNRMGYKVTKIPNGYIYVTDPKTMEYVMSRSGTSSGYQFIPNHTVIKDEEVPF